MSDAPGHADRHLLPPPAEVDERDCTCAEIASVTGYRLTGAQIKTLCARIVALVAAGRDQSVNPWLDDVAVHHAAPPAPSDEAHRAYDEETP